jgi:hypothetical protein
MDDHPNQGRRYLSERSSHPRARDVATVYPPATKQRSRRRIKQRFSLILGFFIVLILACVGGITSVALYRGSESNATVKVTPTASTAQVTAAKNVVVKFYTALKAKNYKGAIVYFDPKGTITVNGKPQKVSPALLQKVESQDPVKDFEVTDATPSSNSQVVVSANVTRRVMKLVTVTLIMENNTWRIINY